MSESVFIYTDGAVKGNPGKGGYGIVMIYKQHRKELSGGFRLSTNNRMELLSVIIALETLKGEGLNVIVHSDSTYVIDSINMKWLDNWKGKGFVNKKNADLWKRFLKIRDKYKVRYEWVKGHADNVENNRCDELAVNARLGENLKIDEGYEFLKQEA